MDILIEVIRLGGPDFIRDSGVEVRRGSLVLFVVDVDDCPVRFHIHCRFFIIGP